MAFPTYFSDGRGDISRQRLGPTVSISKWVEHCLKVDRNFAKNPMFSMVATNMHLKRMAMQMGNLYYNRKITDLTTEKLKEQLQNADFSILKSMYLSLIHI